MPSTKERAAGPEPLVSVCDVRHSYGSTVALRHCSFDIMPGQVHGLIGENGSGKSTLVKVLSGVVVPSGGNLAVAGEPAVFHSPRAAQDHGVVTVFQETLIADELSVRDNVRLGGDGLFRRRAAGGGRDAAEEAFEALGLDPRLLDRPARGQSLAVRQLVTIARALVRPWKLLILDESTSALDLEARDRLFQLIDRRRSDGRSVLFVSHRMEELELLCDSATVLRLGESVATLAKKEATTARLLRLMSPRTGTAGPADPAPGKARDTGATTGDVRLRCRDVRVTARSEPVALEVRDGEIFGVAGLEGHGGGEFLRVLAGLRDSPTGEVSVRTGDGWARVRGYRRAVGDGVVFVPGNRQAEGLFASLPVVDNLVLAVLPRIARFGLYSRRRAREITAEFGRRLRVTAADPDGPVERLSGGNQQKVLVGRWLALEPKVLVMHDPTRGVDQNTKVEMYALLRGLAAEGVAIVLLSTEIDELVAVCDRVAVFRDRSVFAVLGGDRLGHDAVLHAMFGQPDGHAGRHEGKEAAR
ncbi:sugar ABC transporter ATP-binding protein [Actinomadura roseirufa]|uniref:sugar ABC transporter ATP-binding protein n=1 Tax=Actinomadura roseirufa TaxID=2094049 RepID=UPI00104150E8|nr:sugar ABC transporter ATP-binding protein [Actinomadura roseirufa]